MRWSFRNAPAQRLVSSKRWSDARRVPVEDFASSPQQEARAIKRVKFKLLDKRAALVGGPSSRNVPVCC